MWINKASHKSFRYREKVKHKKSEKCAEIHIRTKQKAAGKSGNEWNPKSRQ